MSATTAEATADVSPTTTVPPAASSTTTAEHGTEPNSALSTAPSTAPRVASEPIKIYKEVQCLPEHYFSGSLFKDDNTGTDKLKGLLTGLKKTIHDNYSETDSPDLMPDELATFYRDLDGDMDQLFLQTPNPSIAFIYKSLGCPYSLQPKPYSAQFIEPDIPALKSEGWIIWTTIQLLLGPEEHSAFLMRAVEKWDVVDPITGLTFPKTLSRECFPAQADTKMVAWYEGVSERLRKEAEDEAEERKRHAAMAEHRRTPARREDDVASVDSRGPALAYFRNPLYRHVDGRPSIVRPSRRPPLSPRHSVMDKAKNGAYAVGNVIRNVANPHLWDGPSSSGSSRERERNRDHRRRSVPDNRYHHPSEPAPEGVTYIDREPGQRRRRARDGRPPSGSYTGSSDDRSPRYEEDPRPGRSPDHRSPSLRHSRSHDPTPTQREHGDYFDAEPGRAPRRGSAFEGQDTLRPPAIGPSFAPSNAPPFAAQVAAYPSVERPRDDRAPPRRDQQRQHSPRGARRDDRRDDRRGPPRERSRPPPLSDPRHDDPPRRDERRGPARERSRPPPLSDPQYDDPPRSDERRGPPRERSRPPPRSSPRFEDDTRDRDRRGPPEPRDRSHPRPHRPRSSFDDDRRGYDSPERRPVSRNEQGRRSVGSDLDSGYSGPEDARRGGKPKQARFAPKPVQGVDGRRYVDEAPWR